MSTLTLGEIVSWTAPSQIDLQALREALQAAGIDAKILREMLPRNAFARAARQLAENRVILQTGQEGQYLYFQFTRQIVEEAERSVDFWKEAILRLNKATGEIDCHSAPNLADFEQSQLVDMVRRNVEAELSLRRGADITILVQRIFKRHVADLVSIREAGGAYFVPANQTHVTDTVQSILEKIGGRILRFGIGGGSTETSRSIADSLSQHLQGLVEEFRQFYFRWIVPDLCYVVLEPAGGTRFSGQRLGAGLDVAVVGTTSGGLIPVRDHHIYAVVECPTGQHSSTPDAVSMEIGQIIHRTMCGRAKLGRDITLGEIAAAAEAQVAARMADRFHKAPVVDPMGAADRPPGGSHLLANCPCARVP
jgi:hypothetical protein